MLDRPDPARPDPARPGPASGGAGRRWADLRKRVLALIDLSLAANLLLIVIFSGYENFVSRMDLHDHEDRPNWQGEVDFSGLKLKLVASIVAISGIHLLKVFMDVGKYAPEHIRWMVVIHLVFVVSGVLLAAMDWISNHGKSLKKKPAQG